MSWQGASGACGFTPLCPAGHLPHKEGDQQDALPPLRSQTSRLAGPRHESISTLVGEMPGRAERGEAANTEANV
ncbi:hypothetical protein A6U94_20385 [Agrobacterium tumefaciens]|nr:hypothetical protein A6U94_20385 [Agrobacterium tumefaciens]